MRTTYWLRKPGHNILRSHPGLVIGAIVTYWTKVDTHTYNRLAEFLAGKIKLVSYYYESGQVDSDSRYDFPNKFLFKRVSKVTFLATLL